MRSVFQVGNTEILRFRTTKSTFIEIRTHGEKHISLLCLLHKNLRRSTVVPLLATVTRFTSLTFMSQEFAYPRIANAKSLAGRERIIYRLLEMLPGTLALATLGGLAFLAWQAPSIAAYFTIAFSIYWLLKTVYLSLHLRHNFKRMRQALATDWNARLENVKHGDIVHLVIFPFYKEPYEVVEHSLESIADAAYDHSRIAIVLAAEGRAGSAAREIAERAKSVFSDRFLAFEITTHPEGLPGELAGKGANISYAAEEARTRILDPRGIPYEKTLVSAFDIDTAVYPQYFSCLTWHFLTAERPLRSSFQPVPLYNNNIWSAPMLSRVLAYSSSFWQMIQQERPEKLATFSSHAVPFSALYECGYWQRDIVSEDSRIYWNLFARYDGAYEVIPLSYPVSMDANVAPTFMRSVANLYKQHRRWAWGVENVPYILYVFLKNPRIPRGKKWRVATVQIEGFWSLSTNPLILFVVGWLPLIIGGPAFNATVLSYNLPIIARGFLTGAMFGLAFSAIYAMQLMPRRPEALHWRRSAFAVMQWVLVPFTMIAFSAIPGLDAQLRLLFGRYMGFWVTPKERTVGAPKTAPKLA